MRTSGRQIELARQHGGLPRLSVALTGQAMIATWRGEFENAAALAAEDDALKQATGIKIARYGAMLLAAYQGRVAEASTLITETIEDSASRGEGLGVDLARWSAAILYNSVGRFAEALDMASPASPRSPGFYISTWMLPERIEAAVRSGAPALAAQALAEFRDTAHVADSDWGLGLECRCRAMLSTGDEAEQLYRRAIEHLRRTPIRTELARTHLVLGEWLRRENRRVDARAELHVAYDMFVAMSADGFAERARHELVVSGEHVSKRRDDTGTELTAQEKHIARLAREGRTNAQIAAELFLSARTVEWHLRKVFVKLNITSRRELAHALPSRGALRPPV
jgi:DNA-binding CsgD family transcriptional regulator